MIPPILRTRADLRALTVPARNAGQRVGVVPTMGALHDGHLSLVAAAKAVCDVVVVTIFVNPKQFNNANDLENYPRTETEDAKKLERFDVDAIYAPDVSEIYPDGFATTVSVTGLTDVLCGAHRPGHFDGVATVVSKLFLQTQATDAFFGEKDFQQLQIVRRVARDLDIPIEVHGCPTIREMDGLAMSSRNLLLSDQMRAKAAALHREMEEIVEGLETTPFADLKERALNRLLTSGFTEVEYLELRANTDLSLLSGKNDSPSRLFAAAWIGGVRLIDNLPA